MSGANEGPQPDPLAYFLTWPTYGTWLPGDDRGWVKYGQGRQEPDPVRELAAAASMVESACHLDEEQRTIVERTIAEHCRIRGWTLYAVNCRSNHVHVVVMANIHPDIIREQLKAWCTRRLKENQRDRTASTAAPRETLRQHWWAERGSTRFINDAYSLECAVMYVRDCQERPHGN